ncbi:hypothetical protein CHU98_g7306 [Xylaria longipes]|nr:hypothetical protein CHU98_g7306 [Xylaria longipes]
MGMQNVLAPEPPEGNFSHSQKNVIGIEIHHGSRKNVATLRTVRTLINNLIVGVTKGYKYKMRYVYAHFPINVNLDKNGETGYLVLTPVKPHGENPLLKEGSWRNHHAFVDAQQLKCMTDIFRILCRPPQDRPDGWLEHFQQELSTSRQGLRQATLESSWKDS